jgi:hypothetical protein
VSITWEDNVVCYTTPSAYVITIQWKGSFGHKDERECAVHVPFLDFSVPAPNGK